MFSIIFLFLEGNIISTSNIIMKSIKNQILDILHQKLRINTNINQGTTFKVNKINYVLLEVMMMIMMIMMMMKAYILS